MSISPIDSFLNAFIEGAKKSGFLVIFMIVILYYQEQRSNTFERKIFECHDQILEVYKENQNELHKVIESNTKALSKLDQ